MQRLDFARHFLPSRHRLPLRLHFGHRHARALTIALLVLFSAPAFADAPHALDAVFETDAASPEPTGVHTPSDRVPNPGVPSPSVLSPDAPSDELPSAAAPADWAAGVLAEGSEGASTVSSPRAMRRSAGVLFLGIGLLCGAAAWMKRRASASAVDGAPALRHLQSIRLGTKQQVALVEVGGRQLLLGVSESDVRLLGNLDAAESDPEDSGSWVPAAVEALREPLDSKAQTRRRATQADTLAERSLEPRTEPRSSDAASTSAPTRSARLHNAQPAPVTRRDDGDTDRTQTAQDADATEAAPSADSDAWDDAFAEALRGAADADTPPRPDMEARRVASRASGSGLESAEQAQIEPMPAPSRRAAATRGLASRTAELLAKRVTTPPTDAETSALERSSALRLDDPWFDQEPADADLDAWTEREALASPTQREPAAQAAPAASRPFADTPVALQELDDPAYPPPRRFARVTSDAPTSPGARGDGRAPSGRTTQARRSAKGSTVPLYGLARAPRPTHRSMERDGIVRGLESLRSRASVR